MRKMTRRAIERRRQALAGAVSATLVRLLTGAALLWLRHSGPGWPPLLSAAALALGLFQLGTIVPVWISLYKRLQEIQGGEEDAAAQY